MDEAEKYERIEQYLAGELSPPERKAFEGKLDGNPQLRKEVALHRELSEAARETDVAEFETALSRAMRKDPSASPPRRRLFILLTLILLLLMLWLGKRLLNKPTPAPAQIYADYIDLPAELPGTVQLRSGDAAGGASPRLSPKQLRQNWSALNEAYRTGNFAEALSLLENLRSSHPEFMEENPDVYFYHRGLLQLQLKQPAEAAGSFAEVRSGNYAEDADWKRALSLLLVKERREEALSLLQRISKSNHPQREEAWEVLNQLQH